MPYIPIPDARIAVGRAVTTAVLGAMRDNAVSLYQDTNVFVAKPDDESVNNTTVLQDDDDFFFEAGPNEIWAVRFRLCVDSIVGAYFSFKVVVPSTGGPSYVYPFIDDSVGRSIIPALVNTTIGAGSSSGDCVQWYDALLLTGSTGGTVKLQWAQTNAKVGNTIVRAGSTMTAQRLDPIGLAAVYSQILDSAVDAKSPGTVALATALRDNPIALYQAREATYKSADQIVNNDTVLRDDNHLHFTIGANETWYFAIRLRLQTPAAAGCKIQIAGPGGASGYVYGYYPHSGTGALRDLAGLVGAPISLPTIVVVIPAQGVMIEGYVKTGGTPGDVKLQWAQLVATVGDTKLLEGSFLTAHRVTPAPSVAATYSTIPDGWIEPEAPLEVPLMTALRDNAVALFNRTRSFKFKPIDQSVPSSTVLVDDNDLFFLVGEDETWHFFLALLIDTGPIHDIKIQITTPDGGDEGTIRGFFEEDAASDIQQLVSPINAPLVLNFTGANASGVTFVEGYVSTGGTAGAVKLQWAQKVSQPTPAIIKQGSFLWARRMDDVE